MNQLNCHSYPIALSMTKYSVAPKSENTQRFVYFI